jgi:hypothetical protein
MIKRTVWQFDLTTTSDYERDEVQSLAEALRSLMADATISAESIKSDLTLLRIEIEEGEP